MTPRVNNFNVNNKGDLEVEFYEGPTMDTHENKYLIDTSYGEQGIGGRRIGIQWGNNIRGILEPNTNYVLELDNIDTNECSATIGIGFAIPELIE